MSLGFQIYQIRSFGKKKKWGKKWAYLNYVFFFKNLSVTYIYFTILA